MLKYLKTFNHFCILWATLPFTGRNKCIVPIPWKYNYLLQMIWLYYLSSSLSFRFYRSDKRLSTSLTPQEMFSHTWYLKYIILRVKWLCPKSRNKNFLVDYGLWLGASALTCFSLAKILPLNVCFERLLNRCQ